MLNVRVSFVRQFNTSCQADPVAGDSAKVSIAAVIILSMETGQAMTSSQPSLEDQLMPSPDPRAKARKRQSEFWQICWLISLSSLLISLYAVFLSQRLAPTDCQHDLDQAALVLADELGKLPFETGDSAMSACSTLPTANARKSA
jgi:hypothetical protein